MTGLGVENQQVDPGGVQWISVDIVKDKYEKKKHVIYIYILS